MFAEITSFENISMLFSAFDFSINLTAKPALALSLSPVKRLQIISRINPTLPTTRSVCSALWKETIGSAGGPATISLRSKCEVKIPPSPLEFTPHNPEGICAGPASP